MRLREGYKPCGSVWRTLASKWIRGPMYGDRVEAKSDGDSVFDELVIDDWFHLEQMDVRTWWIGIGDAHIWVHVPISGPPEISAQIPPGHNVERYEA